MVCIASGMALSSRLRAFHRHIKVFSAFLEIRSASKSAAAFDGAATRTLSLVISLIFSFIKFTWADEWARIKRTSSTSVRVFPVPAGPKITIGC